VKQNPTICDRSRAGRERATDNPKSKVVKRLRRNRSVRTWHSTGGAGGEADEEALVCVSSADAEHEAVEHPTRSPTTRRATCTGSRALTGLILRIRQ
jgi:hypothetical protein